MDKEVEKNAHQFICVSATGTKHLSQEKHCQDASFCQESPNLGLIIAIADGAGSASLGETGANIAVKVAVDSIYSQHKTLLLADDLSVLSILTQAVEKAKNAVETEACIRGARCRDLASTLILTIATQNSVATIQIGDGAVIIGDTRGNITELTIPDNGEYCNETTFLTSPGAIQTAQRQVQHKDVQNLAIFSDGFQRLALKMPEGKAHVPLISLLFRFVEEATDMKLANDQLQSFLESSQVRGRTDDDVTLFLAKLGR